MQPRRVHVGLIAAGVAIVGALVVVAVIVVTRDDHGRRPDDVVEASGASWGSIEWSPDGSRLYVVDAGGIDILSGEPLAITDRIEWARRAATWSPDRSMVALSSSEPGVELIDIASGEKIASLDANGVTAAVPAWSPDGATIALAGEPGEIVTFDPRTGSELDHLIVSDLPSQVLGLAWPRPDRLVAALGNSVVAVDPSTGDVVWSRSAFPRNLVVASDSAEAVVDGEGRVYALDDGADVGEIEVVSDNVVAIDWSPDGEWAIVSGDDDQPQLWETDEAATRRGYTELGPYDAGASWSPDSHRALIPDRYDRRLVVIDVEADDDGNELSIAEDVTIADAAWSPAGDRVAAVGGGNLVFVWAMESED